MARALWRSPKAIIVVHGWGYFTNVMILILAKLRGHKVCLRGESPLNQELKKSRLKLFLSQLFLKGVVFPSVDYFLHIGEENARFYEYYGVKRTKLVFTPYSVDNDRFSAEAYRLLPMKDELKQKFKIPVADFVFLFSGKYIAKKRPMDLIRAFHKAALVNSCLVMVGEGELRSEMEAYIKSNKLENRIILTGFVNQSFISEYYALSDTLVISSGIGETWGLVVNEAMNFGLPVIASDLTGCSTDLVHANENGFIFSAGSIEELAECLKKMSSCDVRGMRNGSKTIIKRYSYEVIANNIKSLKS